MTSAFDPAAFKNAVYTDGIDTRTAKHGAGEFTGHIGAEERDMTFREITRKDGSKSTVLDIYLNPDDSERAKDPNFPDTPPKGRFSVFLDMKEDGKSLDMSPGKNKGLGNLLVALGYQTKEGKVIKPWGFGMFPGSRLRYTIIHKPSEDGKDIYANVDNIAAVG